jgi:hypothetical protein
MPFDLKLLKKDDDKRDWKRASGVMATGLRTRMSRFEVYQFRFQKAPAGAEARGDFSH